MLIAQIITMVVVSLGLIFAYLFCKNKNGRLTNKTFKITSIVLAVVFFFRFMLGYDASSFIFRFEYSQLGAPFITVISLILNWLLYSVVLLLCLYPFFKNSKYTTIIKYYGFIVAILCAAFLPTVSRGIVINTYSGFQIRTLLLGMEIGILLAYTFVVFMENGKFKLNKNDALGFLYIIGMLLATMPPYFISAIFGHAKYAVPLLDFTFPHRIILYLSIIIPIVLFVLLRKKDSETCRGILLYISLGALMAFSVKFKFEAFLNVTNWPLHLCNTALYIIPLCLIFKWEKLFYFTYFINVFGAFIAMAMPNYGVEANIISNRIFEFYINHYIAFFMPLLIVALGIYKKPKLKQFKYSMVGFGIYFVLVLIFNAWFSNYGSVDYFFLNSDFIVSKLGKWAERTRDIVIQFNIGNLKFAFYPLYQFLFFLVYVMLGAGMWFLYEAGYSFTGTIFDILERKKKIKADQLAIEVKNGNGGYEEPMNKENKNKLVIKNFSKKYGNSKLFAVKDASFEVEAGKICGFLGHNGAGKSTIIKSIVGIQPITEGNIEVCGFDVDTQSVMAKRNIGFVPDHYALYEKLTGREYINYIADLYDVSEEERTKAINKYVELFELKEAFDNQIKTYSHGMKQKITIISALVHNPRVWILDEPLTGLDPKSIFQVKECMREHAKAGNIVFFSSHLIDIVEQICDEVVIIKKGKILTHKSVKEIEKETSLEKYFLNISNQTIENEG